MSGEPAPRCLSDAARAPSSPRRAPAKAPAGTAPSGRGKDEARTPGWHWRETRQPNRGGNCCRVFPILREGDQPAQDD